MKAPNDDLMLDILRAIKRYMAENGGRSPGYRDICDMVGINSTSHINYYIRLLEENGYITTVFSQARSIKLTEKGEQYQ